jgi:hypothetical protein
VLHCKLIGVIKSKVCCQTCCCQSSFLWKGLNCSKKSVRATDCSKVELILNSFKSFDQVTLSNLPFPVLLSNCKKINLSYIIINFTIHLKLWIFKSLKLVNTLFKFKAKKCYHLLFPMRFLKKHCGKNASDQPHQ